MKSEKNKECPTKSQQMGVSYVANVSGGDRTVFFQLLFRWSGSVWKLLWLDLVVFVVAYNIFSLIYVFAIKPHADAKRRCDAFLVFAASLGKVIPLPFLLGFFVTTIIGRWWQICMNMPWLSSTCMQIQALMDGSIENPKVAVMYRKRLLRYYNLAWVLMIKDISAQIGDRFRDKSKSSDILTHEQEITATLHRINNDGVVQETLGYLITDEEIQLFIDQGRPTFQTGKHYEPEYWLPLAWANRLLGDALEEKVIKLERNYTALIGNVLSFRSSLGTMWAYTNFNIPLVYTQVVIIAMYVYFISEFFNREWEGPLAQYKEFYEFHRYFPAMCILKFIFYMGWFRVGISLINPLGKDEQDLPMSAILDSNLRFSAKCGVKSTAVPLWSNVDLNEEHEVLTYSDNAVIINDTSL